MLVVTRKSLWILKFCHVFRLRLSEKPVFARISLNQGLRIKNSWWILKKNSSIVIWTAWSHCSLTSMLEFLIFASLGFGHFQKYPFSLKKCLFETKKQSLSKGTCYFLIFHGLKFQIRPPAKQKSNKFGNSDNHGDRYLAILHIFINF